MSAPNTPQDVKITLYWLNKSRAQRILWLLEESKVKYDIEIFHRQSNMLAPPELKEIHPLGKAPIIKVEAPNVEPIILAESGAMAEYIIDHFAPNLAPKRWRDGAEGQVGGETESYLRYKHFIHYAEGSLMPFMLLSIVAKSDIKNAPVPFFLKFLTNGVAGKLEGYVRPELENQFKFLESQLETSPDDGEFLCGKELTGADILLSFPLIASKNRGGLTSTAFPKLVAYIEKLEKTDGYKRAVDKIVSIEGSYDSTL